MPSLISSIEFFPMRTDGLKAFKMQRLGSVVLLVGKNGSGKTRILNALERALTGPDDAVGNERQIQELKASIARYRENLNDPSLDHEKDRLQILLQRDQAALADRVDYKITAGQPLSKVRVFSFRQTGNLDFLDPDDLTQKGRSERHRSLNEYETYDRLFSEKVGKVDDSLIRISFICEDYSRLEHPKYVSDERTARKRQAVFERLKETLFKMTNVSIDFDQTVNATLDGKTLKVGSELLSNGQKKLLHFCSTLCDGERLHEPYAVLIDELETFLHPAAFIELIDNLRAIFSNSQFFIATHSVPIIAHLGYTNVYWVEGGHVSWGGEQNLKVLEGLLGGADNVDKLHELTLEPSKLAVLKFASECLFPPTVLDTGTNDPQLLQVGDAINAGLKGEKPVRVLDWGAGKGRLLNALAARLGASAAQALDYIAFEPSGENQEICKQAITNVYPGEFENRYFLDYSALSAHFPDGGFDFVVLCNVLHEVSPREWFYLFRTQIEPLMSDNGNLLIVEDAEIPHGELAHSEGFIITDVTALKRLFGMSDRPVSFETSDERYKGRLFAYQISRALVAQVEPASILAAVEWCHKHSLSRILDLRSKKNTTYRDGLLHSLLCQQHVNAGLALGKLGSKRSPAGDN